MKTLICVLTVCAIMSVSAFLVPESAARRTYLTPEQKQQLHQARTVFVNALTLTEKGRTDPARLPGPSSPNG